MRQFISIVRKLTRNRLGMNGNGLAHRKVFFVNFRLHPNKIRSQPGVVFIRHFWNGELHNSRFQKIIGFVGNHVVAVQRLPVVLAQNRPFRFLLPGKGVGFRIFAPLKHLNQ